MVDKLERLSQILFDGISLKRRLPQSERPKQISGPKQEAVKDNDYDLDDDIPF